MHFVVDGMICIPWEFLGKDERNLKWKTSNFCNAPGVTSSTPSLNSAEFLDDSTIISITWSWFNHSKISSNSSADQHEDWNNIEKCTSFLWSLTTKWQKMAVRQCLRNLTTKCPKLKFAIKFYSRLDRKNLQNVCHEPLNKIWTKNSAMSPAYSAMTQNIAAARLRPFQISKNKISKCGLMLMLFISNN